MATTSCNSEVPMDVFHFEEDRPGFEDIGQDNGQRYWYGR